MKNGITLKGNNVCKHTKNQINNKCPDQEKERLKKRAMGLLDLSEHNPIPENISDIESKNDLYEHYKKISVMLLEYIYEKGGMNQFFGGSDIHNYSFDPNKDSLELFLDNYFILCRKHSIESVKSFFNDFPELLDSKYDSPRYKVGDRIERSSSNVHFVSLFYIYCYLKQYKLKLGKFPILDDKAIDILLGKTKMFGLLMAKELEMGLQMSFLRTTYGYSISDGLEKGIRHGHLIFPENGGINGVKLSENNDYLEINLDGISETVERLNIAIDSNQIPKTGNVIGCPAFPKLIVDIMKHIQGELKLLLKNFS